MALLPNDPKQQKLIAIGAIPILLAVAYWYFLYRPRATEIADVQTHFEELDTKNKATETQVKKYGPNLAKQLELYQQHLVAIEKLIPKRNDIPNLLVAMGEQAQSNQVVWGGFTPSAEEAGQYYSKQSYEISVSGMYHDVAAYLAAIGSLPRIVKTTELKLSKGENRDRDPSLPPVLRALFAVETYVLPAPGEAKPDSAAAPAKGAKK